jgi:hypothetical protein
MIPKTGNRPLEKIVLYDIAARTAQDRLKATAKQETTAIAAVVSTARTTASQSEDALRGAAMANGSRGIAPADTACAWICMVPSRGRSAQRCVRPPRIGTSMADPMGVEVAG